MSSKVCTVQSICSIAWRPLFLSQAFGRTATAVDPVTALRPDATQKACGDPGAFAAAHAATTSIAHGRDRFC